MFRLSLVRLTGKGRHNRGQESGAIAVIVALFVVLGVVLGLGAIVIDVGALHQERRIVQNGADAASLALAEICAKDSSASEVECADTSDTKDYLQALAGDNAGDGRTDILSICGSGSIGERFGTCPEPTDHLTDCVKKTLPADLNYVEVRTRTQTGAATEGTLLKPFVAQAIGDNKGAEVRACARAEWGPLIADVIRLPFTISTCEFTQATGVELVDKVTGAPRIPTEDEIKNGLYGSENETALGFNYKVHPTPAACASYNGHDFPGGFGWTDRQPDCTAAARVDGWLGSQTPESNGIGGGNGCAAQLISYIGKDVNLPIFDCVNDNRDKDACDEKSTSSTWYHIRTFAFFHITALDVTGTVRGATPSEDAAAYCDLVTKDKKCIYGYFQQGISSDGTMGGAETFGLTKAVLVAG